MAIDFPNSPTVGDTYITNGKQYRWDGTAWGIYGTFSPDSTASDTEPTGVGDGHIWYRSDQSQTLIRYDNTWVEVGSAGGFNSSSTSFPTSLDSGTGFAAVEALQAKVGVDSSAVTSSLDYKIAQLPAGQLAIATSTADFTATTSGIDILNTSVTLTSSRILRIIYHIGAVSGPSTNLETYAMILDGPYGTGTQLSNTTQRIGTTFDVNVGWTQVLYSGTFASGTHTFYASAATNTGTCIYNGANTRPHFLIVDDMGAG